ncbi:MAG TPA: hypothetical protein VIJ96_15220 [Acidothermaceae bacterium]
MSSTLDPNVPLPPVDEDSDLVGKNNRLGIPDDEDPNSEDPNSAEAPGVTLPIAGAGAYPLPGVRFGDELEEAVGEDDEKK